MNNSEIQQKAEQVADETIKYFGSTYDALVDTIKLLWQEQDKSKVATTKEPKQIACYWYTRPFTNRMKAHAEKQFEKLWEAEGLATPPVNGEELLDLLDEFRKWLYLQERRVTTLDARNWLKDCLATTGELPAGPKMQPVFEFTSFTNWVNTAQRKFFPFGQYHNIICLDTNGNACSIGEDFRVAEEKGLYPITAYQLIRTAKAEESTPVAPKEEGDHLVPGSRNTDVEPVASHSSTSGYSDKQFSAKPFPTPAEAFKYKRQIECLNALRTLNPLLSPVERRVIKDKVIAKYGSDLLNSEPDPTTERSNEDAQSTEP
jgi:hypothetical protein